MLDKTRKFLSKGAVAFSGESNFFTKTVQILGLAAAVTVFPNSSVNAELVRGLSVLEELKSSVVTHISGTKQQSDQLKLAMLKRLSDFGIDDAKEKLKESYDRAIITKMKESYQYFSKLNSDDVLNNISDFIQFHKNELEIKNHMISFGEYQISHHTASEIIRAAKDTNFPTSVLFAVAEKESSFNETAQSPTSSAYGLMQFVEQTWFETLKKHGADFGLKKEADVIQMIKTKKGVKYTVADKEMRETILNIRGNPYYASVFAAKNFLEAKKVVELKTKMPLEDKDLYLLHFLGASGAGNLIKKSNSKPNVLASAIFPKAAKSNKNLFRTANGKSLTVKQLHTKLSAIIDDRKHKYNNAEFRINLEVKPIVERQMANSNFNIDGTKATVAFSLKF